MYEDMPINYIYCWDSNDTFKIFFLPEIIIDLFKTF